MVGNTNAAIAGIGYTEFSKNSGRSELRLALEAITSALEDAGIAPEEVDGLVTFSMDNNEPAAVARYLGPESVTFFAQTPSGGGGGCGTVALAGLAIAGGAAEVVVCYRAMNEYSQQRFGQAGQAGVMGALAPTMALDLSWSQPFGGATAASRMAQVARRYMHKYGVTSEDFGQVAVVERGYAATNPAAYFYGRPITLEEHQSSRLIADPLRLLDCCQESDGGVAIVVTSTERARGLRQPVVRIAAAAQGMSSDQASLGSPYRSDMSRSVETEIVGRQLWSKSGVSPRDIDLAVLYDHFSCAVLMQLEALGFCKPGEAPAFVRDGHIGPGGSLPVNTNGGQLGEAYIHGFNGIAEAVRQLRGTAANQVSDAETAVVMSASHFPTSGLILTAV